jgi:hypothetical protein
VCNVQLLDLGFAFPVARHATWLSAAKLTHIHTPVS